MDKPFAVIGLALVIGGIALLLYIGYNAFVAAQEAVELAGGM
jgi:hypothetical protein